MYYRTLLGRSSRWHRLSFFFFALKRQAPAMGHLIQVLPGEIKRLASGLDWERMRSKYFENSKVSRDVPSTHIPRGIIYPCKNFALRCSYFGQVGFCGNPVHLQCICP